MVSKLPYTLKWQGRVLGRRLSGGVISPIALTEPRVSAKETFVELLIEGAAKRSGGCVTLWTDDTAATIWQPFLFGDRAPPC